MVRSARPLGSFLLLAPVVALLAACSGASDAHGDESGALTADHRHTDAGSEDAGAAADGSVGDEDGGGPALDGGSADASACNPTGAWASPFVPPMVAGVDWSTTLSIDELIAADCSAVRADDDAQMRGDHVLEWNDGEMFVEYNPKTRAVNRIESYFPFTLAFESRAGGAYGDHTYVVGNGVMTRDGSFMSILWQGDNQVTLPELLDAYTATFFPEMPPPGADCVTSGTCSSRSGGGESSIDFNLPAPADLHLLIDTEGNSANNGTPTAFTVYPNPAVSYHGVSW